MTAQQALAASEAPTCFTVSPQPSSAHMPASPGRDKGSIEEAQPGLKAFALSTTTLTVFAFGILQVLEPQVEAAVFPGDPEFTGPQSRHLYKM